MKQLCAATHESGSGTKWKCSLKAQMSVVGGRTDMAGNRRHFRDPDMSRARLFSVQLNNRLFRSSRFPVLMAWS
jgi:hypothetical protein